MPAAPAREPAGDQLQFDLGAAGAGHRLVRTTTSVLATVAITPRLPVW